MFTLHDFSPFVKTLVGIFFFEYMPPSIQNVGPVPNLVLERTRLYGRKVPYPEYQHGANDRNQGEN